MAALGPLGQSVSVLFSFEDTLNLEDFHVNKCRLSHYLDEWGNTCTNFVFLPFGAWQIAHGEFFFFQAFSL